jgi:MFS family permease
MIGCGRLIDRIGATIVGGVATTALIAVTYLGFVREPSALPIGVLFVGFMAAMGIRGVSTTAIASRVPASHERARFVSFMSVCQHAGSATGAFLSAAILLPGVGGRLAGMERVALTSIAFSVFIMVFMIPLERRVDRLERERNVA